MLRAWRRRGHLTTLRDRTGAIRTEDILAAGIVRNERVRLPHFLEHHRKLGVNHFLFVDNGSDDGTTEFLADQSDVSVWSTRESYRHARFGLDWLTWLLAKHAHGHWCLTLDADEILIYPYWETRDLRALTQWLDAAGRRSFAAMMLDLYPKGPLGTASYASEDSPFDLLCWFDRGNHMIRRQMPLETLWIQGGVRARCFFAETPRRAPTLNKVPLVKWNRRYVYVNSTHGILPRSLNAVYDDTGGEVASGLLLHTKFLPGVVAAARSEKIRGEHFANGALYDDYFDRLAAGPDLWCESSTRLGGWRQAEAMGLMSRGGWI